MSKIIITAANSFIGKRLCKQLELRGHQICAVVRTAFKEDFIFENMENIQIVRCDMEHYKSLPDIVHETFDIGIMLAWNGTRGADRDNWHKQQDNYNFSVDCIHSLLNLGCTTLVLAGSQAEYGPAHGKDKVLETDVCNPNTEYGKSKLQLYHAADAICHNKARLIEPRFFSLYGPDDFEGTMIISMIRNMLQNKPCELTECIQLWDFLYIDDAIDAIAALMESNTAEGIYNFGSGISRPLKKYVEIMYRLAGSNSALHYGKVAYPVTGIVHTNPSIQKLTSETGWTPKVSFTEGIKRVIKYQGELLDEKNKCCGSML